MVDIEKIEGKYNATKSVVVYVLTFIVFLSLVFTTFTDSAYGEEVEFTEGGLKYIHITDQKVKVIGITPEYASKNPITIPSTIKVNGTTYNVTSVIAGAFTCCDNSASIRIPDNIVFEESVFGELDSLSKVCIYGSDCNSIIDCSSLMTNLPGKINSIIIDSSAIINVSELINNKSIETIYFTGNAVNVVAGEELLFYDEDGELLTESKEFAGKNFAVSEDNPYTWNQTPCSPPNMGKSDNTIYIILAIIIPIILFMTVIIYCKLVR